HHRAGEKHQTDHVPFECEGEIRKYRRRRLVECLEQSPAEGSVVDNRAPRKQRLRKIAVNASEPLRLSEEIEAIGMLDVEERLGLPVSHLLLDVGFDGVAAEVPHDRRGAEADRVALILQTPAEVDVVASGSEQGIEAVDLLEDRLPKGHV